MKRKDFVKSMVLGGLAATGIVGCRPKPETAGTTPSVQTKKKYRWKMVTTWPPGFPVLGEGCEMLAQWVKEMSGGRMEIKVYGGGELVPALEAFETVSEGSAQMGSGCPYYWSGKIPAAPFFATVPFGMNAQQMNSWIFCGGGYELWKKAYADFNLVPFAGGNTGVQMGGWYNKEINTIEDFKGLKIRMPGIGGKVMEKVGASAILVAGGELYTSLERGVIDATEWIGPYHDHRMGFHKIAKHYYTPGWHEPGTNMEFFVNKTKLDSLPLDLQVIIETACARVNQWMLLEFEAKNRIYYKKLVEEHHVDVRVFNKDILAKLKVATTEVLEDMVSESPEAKKIYAAYRKYQSEINGWSDISERQYFTSLNI